MTVDVQITQGGYTDSTIQSVLERYTMSDETNKDSLPEWITLGQAIDHPDCKVKSRTTLHAMIARGDVPEECLDYRPLGDGRDVTYINARCLKGLPYRGHGERGLGKRDD